MADSPSIAIAYDVSGILTVVASPTTVSADIDEYKTFTAYASGGTTPYTYQWFEGTALVGDSASLTVSKPAAGTYTFYCKVTDSASATKNSNAVKLVVGGGGDNIWLFVGLIVAFIATGGIIYYVATRKR